MGTAQDHHKLDLLPQLLGKTDHFEWLVLSLQSMELLTGDQTIAENKKNSKGKHERKDRCFPEMQQQTEQGQNDTQQPQRERGQKRNQQTDKFNHSPLFRRQGRVAAGQRSKVRSAAGIFFYTRHLERRDSILHSLQTHLAQILQLHLPVAALLLHQIKADLLGKIYLGRGCF